VEENTKQRVQSWRGAVLSQHETDLKFCSA